MTWFQKSSVWQRIRQEHHAPLSLVRFHACNATSVFHNDISKVAYLVCWQMYLHVDKSHFTVTHGPLFLRPALPYSTCYTSDQSPSLPTYMTQQLDHSPTKIMSLLTHPCSRGAMMATGSCFLTVIKKPTMRSSQSFLNSQLSPAFFAPEDTRIHPILEAWICLLLKDCLSALQQTHRL